MRMQWLPGSLLPRARESLGTRLMHMQLLHKVVGVNSRIPGLHAGAGGGLHRLGYELLDNTTKCS